MTTQPSPPLPPPPEPDPRAPPSPYFEAFVYIQENSGTDSARDIAKLLLSIWNQKVSVSIRECLDILDGPRTELALRTITHFANFGEDDELRSIGSYLRAQFPEYWEAGLAATTAKRQVHTKWRDKGQENA